MDLTARVLYALRIHGVTPVPTVAELAETSDDEAGELLALLAADELVVERSRGAMSGWTLLPAGRARIDGLLAVPGGDEQLHALYEQAFLPLNGRFKQLCTSWQLAAPDGPEREDLVEDLADLHVEVSAFLRNATGLRLAAVHLARLQHALDALRTGDSRYFTGVLVESYHGAWFELHEDLILTLGVDRAVEEAAHS